MLLLAVDLESLWWHEQGEQLESALLHISSSSSSVLVASYFSSLVLVTSYFSSVLATSYIIQLERALFHTFSSNFSSSVLVAFLEGQR